MRRRKKGKGKLNEPRNVKKEKENDRKEAVTLVQSCSDFVLVRAIRG